MAVGDGGFKQVPLGFDKNEVNAYISELRKKTMAMEEEKKASEKKAEAAQKLADEAEERIKTAVQEVQDKADEIQAKLDAELDKTAKLEAQVNELKAEIESEKKRMSDMLRSGEGVNAEAKKVYGEIVDKANADADAILNGANEKASQIVAAAQERCAATNEMTSSFLELIKSQMEIFSESYKTISESAVEMLGADAVEVPVIEMPQPVKAATAPAAAPIAEEAPTAVEAAPAPVQEAPAAESEETTAEQSMEELLAAAASAFGVQTAAAEPVADSMPATDSMPAAEKSDAPASFDDVWGGNELAQTIYNDENKNAVPLVNPDAGNLGKDIFGIGITEEDEIKAQMESIVTEKPEEPEAEELVDEVKPLDVSEVGKVDFDSSFDNDLISQTMPTSSLTDVGDDMLEALKAAEASFAVQPSPSMDPSALDMDMSDEEEAPAAADTEDDLMKALREAEEALNNMVPFDSAAEKTETSAPAADDPWADLQKQLEAMEQSGNVGDADVFGGTSEPEPVPAEELAAVPTTDDSAIWDFGGSSSDSDDDMSSDFGGFGGF